MIHKKRKVRLLMKKWSKRISFLIRFSNRQEALNGFGFINSIMSDI